MANRVAIPRAVRDGVMKEFNHMCAACGRHRPQIHHIDEDSSNNDPLNLLPLCPNCHLTDQHDPTQPIEPGILRLLRQYKDPTVLRPQFQPLYSRMKFLECIEEDSRPGALAAKATELADFIAALEMGTFYSQQVRKLLALPRRLTFAADDAYEREVQRRDLERGAQEDRARIRDASAGVIRLVIELLRFQKWTADRPQIARQSSQQ